MISVAYKYFLTVAKTCNFHKASIELYVSQPAISKQISHLEKRLGYPLLYRTTRTVSLTPEGKILYRALLECYNVMEKAESAIKLQQAEQSLNGVLRIGLLHGWNPNLFGIPFISNFSENNPNAKIYYERHSHRTLVKLLQESVLDIIVSPIEEIQHETGLSFTFLGRYPFMAVLSIKHPLAKYDYILDKLDGTDLYTHAHVDRTAAIKRLGEYGIHSNIIVAPNIDSKILAAESGLGYTIVLSCSQICESPMMRAYKIDTYSADLVVAYKSDNIDRMITKFISNLIHLQGNKTETETLAHSK